MSIKSVDLERRARGTGRKSAVRVWTNELGNGGLNLAIVAGLWQRERDRPPGSPNRDLEQQGLVAFGCPENSEKARSTSSGSGPSQEKLPFPNGQFEV